MSGHALVAGAEGPLGRAIAVGLAAAGADVSVTTRSDDDAAETAVNSILNECWTYGREGQALRLDLADLDAVGGALARLEGELAPLDLLVNLAFGASGGEPASGDWRAAIGGEAAPAFVLARAAGPRMHARGAGRIVSVLPPERGLAGGAARRAARAAVVGLSEGLAAEWAEAGVAVEWIEEAPPERLLALLLPDAPR